MAEYWQEKVKGMLKAELKRRNITYAQLVDLLAEFDIHESQYNIRNKMSRGSFSAVFFVQCLMAIGVDYIAIDYN
jgi:hypothetical protein